MPDPFVTTKSYTGVHHADPGDCIIVCFDGFPEMRVTFN
jgi:hypothetical protein